MELTMNESKLQYLTPTQQEIVALKKKELETKLDKIIEIMLQSNKEAN